MTRVWEVYPQNNQPPASDFTSKNAYIHTIVFKRSRRRGDGWLQGFEGGGGGADLHAPSIPRRRGRHA